jgi:hypothetical protein
MLKLSQMRQSVESSMDTLLSLNRLPPDGRKQAERLRNDIQTIIPFTSRDVIALGRPENADRTLAEVIQSQGGGNIPTDRQGVVVTPSDLTRPGIRPDIGGAPADASGGDITEILLEQGAKYNAQGQLVDDRGWHLEQDGDDYAWVNPERTDFEPIAFTPGMN